MLLSLLELGVGDRVSLHVGLYTRSANVLLKLLRKRKGPARFESGVNDSDGLLLLSLNTREVQVSSKLLDDAG